MSDGIDPVDFVCIFESVDEAIVLLHEVGVGTLISSGTGSQHTADLSGVGSCVDLLLIVVFTWTLPAIPTIICWWPWRAVVNLRRLRRDGAMAAELGVTIKLRSVWD